MTAFFQRAIGPFFVLALFFSPLLLQAEPQFVLNNPGVMPSKEVEKIEAMGRELYLKTKIPVFVAIAEDLNRSKPVMFIEKIKREYPTYLLLYFSLHPPAVNIFASPDAKQLVDIDQILSPLPWRGTIRPIMGPGFGKDEAMKKEVAVFNGYADIVEQVAESKGVKLTNAVGSESKITFQIIRLIFYAILAFAILRYFYHKRKRRVEGN